ncbi:MAG: Fur family transcriptional regulator [Acidimicrobiales bacterium]
MPPELHTAIASRLRAVGQRYTTNRRTLVDVLLGAGQPLGIPEILGAGERLAQSSVYRNLAVLEQAGAVHRIVTGDFARYELAEDLTDDHHHHLVCSVCGDVSDFTAPAALETSLTKVMAKVADETGFAPDRHRLDLLGTCTRCA